jgi:histidinol-phosphate/aromatic aminotransferase/cobyric acid decarboxylase-like protein
MGSSDLTRSLAEKEIIIKDVSSMPMLEDCVRITVGSREINERFLEAVKGLVGKK